MGPSRTPCDRQPGGQGLRRAIHPLWLHPRSDRRAPMSSSASTTKITLTWRRSPRISTRRAPREAAHYRRDCCASLAMTTLFLLSLRAKRSNLGPRDGIIGGPMRSTEAGWPALDYDEWKDSCATLHL